MKYCNVCNEQWPQERYSMMQWFKKDSERICKACILTQQEEQQEAEKAGQEDTTPTIGCISRMKILQVDTLATGLSKMEISTMKPPRDVDQILGDLQEATAPVIYELLDVLAYERSNSTAYLNAVQKLNCEKNSTEVPTTFETESMISTNQYLLTGPSPFSLRKQAFKNTDFGVGLLLEFKDREDNALHPIVYVGECSFSPMDLWYFAWITNKRATERAAGKKKDGIPERFGNFDLSPPHHHSVLLCPFCATMLDPRNDDQKYIMLARVFYEFGGDMEVGFQILQQLCCKSCFVKNLIKNGEDWGKYPGCERYGLYQSLLTSGSIVPVTTDTASIIPTSDIPQSYCPSAEDLHSWMDKSGLERMFCMYSMENMSQHYSKDSTTCKIKLSKSLSKESGLEVMKMNLTQLERRTCFACGINIFKTSACSKCKNAHYCSKACQRLHWREHKKVCSPETKVQPLPCDRILMSTKDRYSMEERQNHENFCKSCNEFTGDSHGKEAYCFGCAKFLFCGPCNGMPKNNDGEINGGKPATHYKGCCPDCVKHLDTNFHVMLTALQNLVEKDPTGIHVKHMRLCIAQLLLDEHDGNDCGVKNGIVYAKEEIKWLANNLDYAPAQLLLASLHDPVCQSKDIGVYNGPMPVGKISKRNFYEANIAVAKKYYERACEQKLSSALVVVGSYFQRGSNPLMFQKDEAKGMSMLEEAAAMGHTQAIYIVGGIYLFEKMNREKGIELFRDAAFNGHYDAMYHIGIVGQVDKRLRSFGKWCVFMLLQKKIPFEKEKQHQLKHAASFYGIV